jgi:prophage tail gpP-like protein
VDAPRLRIRTPSGGDPLQAMTVTGGASDDATFTNCIPAKEWCIEDDVLNVSDSLSFTVANDNGENAGKFRIGQKIIADEQHPDVAGGRWVRMFTGRITSLDIGSDAGGGSIIVVGAMDLGWHLTQCHAEALKNIKNIQFLRLLRMLLDATWGITLSDDPTTDAVQNTRLKHGRQVIVQGLNVQLKAVLPYIQVEPGQAPFDLIRLYAQREGVLVNVGARGELIFFRPDYNQQALYRVEYHSTTDPRRNTNNLIGRTALRESIDGLYSEVQCWSTIVISPKVGDTEDPNAAYRHTTYKPSTNPLPFHRRHIFSDGEAINDTLRKNRAIWKHQREAFGSWSYEVEFDRHHQVDSHWGDAAFFVANTMISCDDTVNGVPSGSYYVQRVRRSVTLREGTRTKLLIRKPGLLNPELDALRLGGGAKRAAKTKSPTP